MSKNSKCINIFEKDKKDLNLYQISILIIVFMTILQIGINSFKNNQLNEFISDYEYEKDLKTSEINTSSSNNLNKEKSKINLEFMTEILQFLSPNQKHRKKGLWGNGNFPVVCYKEKPFLILPAWKNWGW